MEEDELRQIREARLRELKKSGGGPGGGPGGGGGGAGPDADRKDEMKASVLSQLLTQDARERLNRVRIVKPERAEQVEQMLLRMGQTGQLAQRVSERELVSLLDQLAQRDQSANKIVISRRETDFDRDEPKDAPAAPRAPPQAASDDDDDFFD